MERRWLMGKYQLMVIGQFQMKLDKTSLMEQKAGNAKLDPEIREKYRQQWKDLGLKNIKEIAARRKGQPLDEKRASQLEAARQKKKEKGTSQETRDKLSNSLKNHTVSQETRDKISKSLEGRKLSQEHKDNISAGRPRNRVMSEEERKRRSESAKRMMERRYPKNKKE